MSNCQLFCLHSSVNLLVHESHFEPLARYAQEPQKATFLLVTRATKGHPPIICKTISLRAFKQNA